MLCHGLFVKRNYRAVTLKEVKQGYVIAQELYEGIVYYLVMSDPLVTGEMCSVKVKILNAFTPDCLPLDYLLGKNTVITELSAGDQNLSLVADGFWKYYETLRPMGYARWGLDRAMMPEK